MTKKEYYLKNKIVIDAKNKKWREENLEKYKETKKIYYIKNKQKAIAAAKRWKKRNPLKNKEINKIYREKNRERILVKNHEYVERKKDFVRNGRKKYYDKNKDKILLKRRQYRHLHPEKARNYVRIRRKTDIQFKLRAALRHRLFCALKGGFKRGSAIELLGCTIPELKKYLESQFQEGMT